jgi:hypothetical protein
MQPLASGLLAARHLSCLALLSLLSAPDAAATEDTVLFLEENRVAAEAPLELHTTATGSTWIDFFADVLRPFRIRFDASPSPKLTIVNDLNQPLFTLDPGAIQVDKPLTAQSSLTVAGATDLSGAASVSFPSSGISGAGAGSGLDADRVDGLSSASFLRSDASSTLSAGTLATASGTTMDVNGAAALDGATSLSLPATGISGAGAGSGLDADKVDGLSSASFLRADASSTLSTGTLATTSGTTMDVNGAAALDGATSLSLPATGISGAGAGSGLDADKLDALDSGSLLRSDDSDVWNEQQSGLTLRFAGSATQDLLRLDAANNRVGVGSASPQALIEAQSATEQLRLSNSSDPATDYASLTVSSDGALTIAPRGDLVLDVDGRDVYPSTPFGVNLGTPTNPFGELHVGELVTTVLSILETFVTSNERLVVGAGTELINAAGTGDTVWTVKHNNMILNDFLFLQGVEPNGAPKFEVVKVTAAPTQSGEYYAITVERNAEGSASGADSWSAGSAVFNLGQGIGYGWLDLYSRRSLQDVVTPDTGFRQNGPTLLSAARTGAGWNQWQERAAFGNLDGLFGFSGDIYGLAAGDPDAAWVAADPNNGFRVMSGTEEQGRWFANGDVLFGNAGDGRGNLFWRNSDSDLLLRQGSVAHLQLDAATGNVFAGLDASAPATTRFALFSADTGYNGETFGAGDLLLGNNSAAKGNLWWDESTGSLNIRSGVNQKFRAESSGNVYVGRQIETGANQTFLAFFGTSTPWDGETRSTGDILLNNANGAGNEGNILWNQSAGQLLMRAGLVPKLRLDTDGDFFIGTTAGTPATNYFAVFGASQPQGSSTSNRGRRT